jgi:hypothetical protein
VAVGGIRAFKRLFGCPGANFLSTTDASSCPALNLGTRFRKLPGLTKVTLFNREEPENSLYYLDRITVESRELQEPFSSIVKSFYLLLFYSCSVFFCAAEFGLVLGSCESGLFPGPRARVCSVSRISLNRGGTLPNQKPGTNHMLGSCRVSLLTISALTTNAYTKNLVLTFIRMEIPHIGRHTETLKPCIIISRIHI